MIAPLNLGRFFWLSLLVPALIGLSFIGYARNEAKAVTVLRFLFVWITTMTVLLWSMRSTIRRALRGPDQLAPQGPRCKVCGYALYGLPQPRCPECGTSSEPS